MYLLARQAVVRGQDVEKWAVDIGAAVSSGLGVDVGVWTNVLSPGIGTVTWTSRWENLGAIERGFATLAGDAKYLALVADGRDFVNGPLDDSLYEVVYPGSAPSLTSRYASTVFSNCSPGNLARGVLTGIEIAQKAEQATGVSTSFLTGQTGPYGGVLWLAAYDTIEEFEAAQHKLAAETSFIEYVDSNSDAYLEGANVTRTVVHMRLN
jgi:hypothetical protein